MESPQHSVVARSGGTQGTMLVPKDEARTAALTDAGAQHVNLDQAALVGVAPPFQGQRFALRQGKTTIGRRRDNDLVLADDSVSSMHAWVIEEQGHYRVMNILSTNGTYVNDVRITEVELKQGDRIRFGGVELELHTGRSASGLIGNPWALVIAGVIIIGATVVGMLLFGGWR